MTMDLDGQTFPAAIRSSSPVLVDFWRPGCPPCRLLKPELESLARTNPAGTVFKVNTDDHPDLAVDHGITAVPTLMFFRDGQVVQQLVGFHRATEIQHVLDALK